MAIRKRRNIVKSSEAATEQPTPTPEVSDDANDIEVYAKEVLMSMISDNLPPTPNNYSLYFDRLLEEKNESLRKQIITILEFEQDNDDELTIALEKSLKNGFTSIKSILTLTAALYKNLGLMSKILDKRKGELSQEQDIPLAQNVIHSLENDVNKLSTILKDQLSQMKSLYSSTADVVKNVENETIYDNKFGVFNRRHLVHKLEQEIALVKEFKHASSLITLELSKELEKSINNSKALTLMTRTIARLLMKTSRRSDIVAHYGNGVFAMLLKHTNLDSATKASERLSDLVGNSNFFLAEKEIQLKISIGIAELHADISAEKLVSATLNAMNNCYSNNSTYCVVSQEEST
ncbi:MAG TPA: GGDEF domain-containing protein [Helicobacteraceae bacterium]|nr:GGDEF domain-containing protein [Helicobacteraceae bacterium]